MEQHAPGFGSLVSRAPGAVAGRPGGADANLVRRRGGRRHRELHQQLIFRPVPGLGRAETPIDGVYLASASAHPGGGVHGGPGANAALAAIRRARPAGALRRRALDVAFRRIYR